MNRDQDGLVGQRGPDRLDVHQTVTTHRHVGHLDPLPLQPLANVERGPLLDRGGHDVVALLPVHLRHTLERQV